MTFTKPKLTPMAWTASARRVEMPITKNTVKKTKKRLVKDKPTGT